MRLIIVATHQVKNRSSSHLLRLIESVQSQESSCPIMLYCLLQGVSEVPETYAGLVDKGRLSFVVNESFVSLSAARNQILSSVSIQDDDVVIFQDDDAYLQPGVAEFLLRLMQPSYVDLAFVMHGEPPEAVPGNDWSGARAANIFDVMRRICSINIVVKGKIAKKTGYFDPILGLGADLGGGEDTDYALRAWKNSSLSLFINVKIIGHRPLNDGYTMRVTEMSRYWPGLMYATIKNFELKLTFLLIYRIMAGIYLVFLRKISFSIFLKTGVYCIKLIWGVSLKKLKDV